MEKRDDTYYDGVVELIEACAQCGRTGSRSASGDSTADGLADEVAPLPPSRILIVTGMGMRGKQENSLSSRAGLFFTPSVPVVVNRYGVFRSGSIFRYCQQAAVRRIAEWLRYHACRCSDDQTQGRPCVIAHSYGAWLVGHALQQNPDIRLGRIIVAGSVLRPDFDWHTLVVSGRVEAVLNHCGGLDMWSWVSEFFIPESGPSGCRGFAACPSVLNRIEPHFRHMTFFQERRIDEVHQSLWLPFLVSPGKDLRGLVGPDQSRSWHPRSWLMRANLARVMLLVGMAAGVAELVLSAAKMLAGLQW